MGVAIGTDFILGSTYGTLTTQSLESSARPPTGQPGSVVMGLSATAGRPTFTADFRPEWSRLGALIL